MENQQERMAEEEETIKTILKKLGFFIIPAKVLGLLPWRIDGDGLTREGLFRRMCSIFLLVVPSLMTIKNLFTHIKVLLLYELGKIFNPFFIKGLTLAGNLVVVINEVYREFTDAVTGLEIITSLAKYDRRVRQLGLAREDSFLFTWIITLSIIPWLLASLFTMIHHILTSVHGLFSTPGPMIIRVADHLARLKFAIIVHFLYQRYNHLNEIVLPKDEWRVRGNMAVNRRSVNMRDLVYLHFTLTRATKILVKIYSFELFVWVSSPIWELLVGLYHMTQSYYPQKILGLTEAVHVLVAFWGLCWICHKTAQEANIFARRILQTDPELINAIDINEQLDAAIYMYNNKILFRAGILCDVDFSALLYIASLTLSLGSVVFDGQHGLLDFRQSHHAQ